MDSEVSSSDLNGGGSTCPKHRPTLLQLEASAARLLKERVVSKGGAMPSEEAFQIVCRTLAERALRDFDEKQAAVRQPSTKLTP